MSGGDGRPAWRVHKLGGTSLARAERFEHAGAFLGRRAEPRQAVVVSAMAGLTDALLGLARDAARGVDVDPEDALGRARSAARSLLPRDRQAEVLGPLEEDAAALAALLDAASRLRVAEPTLLSTVAGLGEVWSARLLAAHLRARGRAAEALDAREVLFLAPDGAPDEARSEAALLRWLEARPALEAVAITGFVASAADGRATTLGRNGSDLSATLFARLLGAASVTIWTDVAGVLTADPRRVPAAERVPQLTYAEAMELAHFGAKILHPKTVAPALAAGIPVDILSALEPEAPGTRIDAAGAADRPVKAITTIEGMAMVEIAGPGLLGVPGTARRVFGQLEGAGISVVLITQGSSEHAIGFAVPAGEAERAAALVDEAFYAERHRGEVSPARVSPGLAILALVGEGMAGCSGVLGRAFDALGRAHVNVRAVAQGSSERNVSVVVDAQDATRALRSVHAAFWLSKPSLSIAVLGAGVVGGTLLDQLAQAGARLREEAGVDIRVRAITNRRRMWLADGSAPFPADWRARLDSGEAPDLSTLVAHLAADGAPHLAVVDATASDALPDRYPAWLARGIHVVTANKRAGSEDLGRYRRIRAAARGRGSAWHYETTVGAGLPVLGALRDLVETGDEILEIEGLLSGTLSWLFTTWDGARPFSEVVREAKRRGFTEPDVRDDLGGLDVARKAVILAREAGWPLSLGDVRVESLVPDGLRDVSPAEALERLDLVDAELHARLEAARSKDQVLRMGARVGPRGAEVALRGHAPDHPFAAARGTDNVIRITSARYRERPLVVQGPGAGPEVTAAGVFAELMALARAAGGR